jgi:2-hydroxychromene-2-carboxylate isomerase
VAHPVFKTGRAGQPPAWKVRFLRRSVAAKRQAVASRRVAAEAVFYFDFNSPFTYLASERIGDLIPAAKWKPFAYPILLNQIGKLEEALARDPRAALQSASPRAAERGLPPLKPPAGWPRDTWSLAPLRAALFADEHGRLKEFTAAAFRTLFVESRSLAELENLRDAAREAGLEPDDVEQATQRPDIKQRLKDHTDEALARGVTGIPTIAIGDELFWGDDRLEEAASRL